MVSFFGEDRERIAYAEFEDVFEALQRGEIVYGVLPIENSSTGGISKVYDLLGSYGFYIVGEKRMQIDQNLMAPKGATLESIRTVYSHVQGFEQSAAFLSKHRDWELVPFHNTAVSAKYVCESADCSKAAIANKRAAQLYGLQLIAPDIQDNSNNMTRFIVIGRRMLAASADKVSVVFMLEHEAGTLYRALSCFAQEKINLVKIESRPIPNALWQYLFYLDFEGDIGSEQVKRVLDKVQENAKEFRLLGAYQSDRVSC